MRKFYFTLVIGLLSLVSFAQNRVDFTLDNSGKYIISGSTNDYYVFQYEGESQSALFNKALIGVTKTFVSAKDVVSKVENSLISINSTHAIEYYLAGIVKIVNHVNYIIELEFKDGKIKINAPTIVSIRNRKGEIAPISDFILTPSGERADNWVRFLFVNDVINNILSNIKTTSSDDW